MPLGLVLFGDKSHFDLHGALATTPISFTLSIFNQSARNKPEFWMPLAYIPNLNFEKFAEQGDDSSRNSLIDEHRCLEVALASLRKLHRKSSLDTVVLKKKARSKFGCIA